MECDMTQFQAVAERFIQNLTPHTEGATVVALQGDLGAGKTTFVQHCARALGVTEAIASPTFVIQKAYPLTGQPWNELVHVDAYRLDDALQLGALNWHDTIQNPKALVMIEWPEKVVEAIPPQATHVHFTYIDEQTRDITYD